MASSGFPCCLLPEVAPPQGPKPPQQEMQSSDVTLSSSPQAARAPPGQGPPSWTVCFQCPPSQSQEHSGCPVNAGCRCRAQENVRNTWTSPPPRYQSQSREPQFHQKDHRASRSRRQTEAPGHFRPCPLSWTCTAGERIHRMKLARGQLPRPQHCTRTAPSSPQAAPPTFPFDCLQSRKTTTLSKRQECWELLAQK